MSSQLCDPDLVWGVISSVFARSAYPVFYFAQSCFCFIGH